MIWQALPVLKSTWNNIPNLNLKLATWNLCLGLSNKKDVVSQTILSNEIDICVLQEIDIPAGYDFFYNVNDDLRWKINDSNSNSKSLSETLSTYLTVATHFLLVEIFNMCV